MQSILSFSDLVSGLVLLCWVGVGCFCLFVACIVVCLMVLWVWLCLLTLINLVWLWCDLWLFVRCVCGFIVLLISVFWWLFGCLFIVYCVCFGFSCIVCWFDSVWFVVYLRVGCCCLGCVFRLCLFGWLGLGELLVVCLGGGVCGVVDCCVRTGCLDFVVIIVLYVFAYYALR